jgi:ADP-ribose pyrophosphatase YjhB (NUDIX family)
MALIRRCFSCGGKLERQYVPTEQARRHVCQKCGQITYLNPKIVAGLIPVMPDGRLVLLRRNIEPALGRWSYAAGFQEMGETVEQAAAREAWEEIAAQVDVGNLVGIYSYEDAGVVTIVYEGRVKRGERPSISLEAKEVAFFKRSEIPWKDLAFRSTTEALKDWMKKNRRLKTK